MANKLVDLSGLQLVWNETLERLAGKADLENGHVKAEQLQLKTINNQSIKGDGNISIDLSLYKIVETLPTEDIDTTKIYLVVNSGAPEGNVYSEYIYANSKWELLGQYKADIDLTPYLKIAELGDGLTYDTDNKKAKINNTVTAVTTAAFLKMKYNAQGLVTGSEAVTKADITALGIPAQDTTYTNATASADGLMPREDKAKLDGWELATSAEVEKVIDGTYTAPTE